MKWHLKVLLCVGALSAIGVAAYARLQGEVPLTGVTFANSPGSVYVPARDLGRALGSEVVYNDDEDTLKIGNKTLNSVHRLLDGTSLVKLSDVQQLGGTVEWDKATETATLHFNHSQVMVKAGEKHVVVDKANQRLTAYQGSLVVLQSKVSTGRPGHNTPSGAFHAGPTKQRMHYSHLYNEAPMPYSVQVDGNVFIHGFTSVPSVPASHGCIRMPLNHGNPAKEFYNWVDVGTPVTVKGTWKPVWRHHRLRRHGRVHRWHRRRIARRHIARMHR